jgi:DNA mismatch repair protein MSH6
MITDMDDFIVPDDSDEEPVSKKRKRPSATASRKNSSPVPTHSHGGDNESDDVSSTRKPSYVKENGNMDIQSASTASQWNYDPENIARSTPHRAHIKAGPKLLASGKPAREKVAHKDPEERHSWLVNIKDIDGNPVGHGDYDPRTIFVPKYAMAKFSAFEKQYWEIKQKLWDTIVFFKKGKFYELYENDATIGHQLFDLKLTDRVNMRMVGVPEMSLDHWAAQFVAKGYKIARVDQKETALSKEMRDREESNPKAKVDKIIHRELSCVLTAGTLVDESMLQDEMSTYCVAIKEELVDGLPAFGISFVDTATGQFFLTEFVDDADMTKFETFVAQTRPQELLLEKSCTSIKALRILKNNTGPTTLWSYLKPGKEFWDASTTRREIDAGSYFISDPEDNADVWPEALKEVREKELDLVMSAFGALLQYLRTVSLLFTAFEIAN